MKRVYSTPASKVINIKTERIIATSVGINFGESVDAGSSLTNQKGSTWDESPWSTTESFEE